MCEVYYFNDLYSNVKKTFYEYLTKWLLTLKSQIKYLHLINVLEIFIAKNN